MSVSLRNYAMGLFFYVMLALGVWQKWWAPAFLENALEMGLAGFMGFHSLRYGAEHLTSAHGTSTPPEPTTAPVEAAPVTPSPTEPVPHDS